MRIAIIGRSELMLETAKKLVESNHEIVLVITSKEAPEYKVKHSDFELFAITCKASYLYSPAITKQQILNQLNEIGKIDIGISVNYSGVISQEVIELFPFGILNAHGGDLPRYRGNACQAWAMIKGEEKIGLCIHRMIGGELDSGDILARDYFPINFNTKIREVYHWMERRIPELFVNAVEKLEADNSYILERQSKNPKDALRCYPRLPEDGRIDWSMTNIEIIRLINASGDPYSGSFCEFNNDLLYVIDAEIFQDEEVFVTIYGQVSGIEQDTGYIIVNTGEGKIKLKEVKYNGEICKPAKLIKSTRTRLK